MYINDVGVEVASLFLPFCFEVPMKKNDHLECTSIRSRKKTYLHYFKIDFVEICAFLAYLYMEINDMEGIAFDVLLHAENGDYCNVDPNSEEALYAVKQVQKIPMFVKETDNYFKKLYKPGEFFL